MVCFHRILHSQAMPEPAHIAIIIHTVPLYVPMPYIPPTQIQTTYISRPVYVEYPMAIVHTEEMV